MYSDDDTRSCPECGNCALDIDGECWRCGHVEDGLEEEELQ